MANTLRVPHGVRTTQITSKAVTKKNELIQSNRDPPLFKILYEQILIFFGVVGKLHACAASVAREVDAVEAAIGVKMVVVLVELWNATAKAVHHH